MQQISLPAFFILLGSETPPKWVRVYAGKRLYEMVLTETGYVFEKAPDVLKEATRGRKLAITRHNNAIDFTTSDDMWRGWRTGGVDRLIVVA